MEGGHKGKEKEEGKGRRQRRRADDGKWPPCGAIWEVV